MEPFVISCTTCKARLKVGSRKAIGQILACPKCKSMVMIVPPADAAQPESPEPTTAARQSTVGLAASTFEYVEDVLTDEPEVPTETAAPTPWLSEKDADVEAVETQPASGSVGPSSEAAFDQPLVPGKEWLGASAIWKQQMLMIALGALAGVVTVASVGSLIYQRWNRNVENPSAAAAANPTVAGPNGTGTDAPAPDTEELPEADSAVVVDQNDDKPPESASDVAAAEPTDVETSTGESVEVIPNGREEVVVVEDSELLEPPVDLPVDDGAALPESTAQAEVRSPEDALVESTDDTPTIVLKPALPPIDVAGLLGESISEIEIEDMALIDFVRFVTQISTVPITVDPDALDYVRRTPNSKISVSAKNTTVEGLLRKGLAPRLHLVNSQGHAVVTSLSKDGSKSRKWEHSLKDLGQDGSLDVVVGWIEQMVAPETWSSRGGDAALRLRGDVLTVVQETTQLYRVLEFVEKLRVARGRSPRSSYPPDRFRHQTRSSRAREAFNAPVRIGGVRPMAFADIVSSIERQANVRILVDWQHLAEVGASPATESKLDGKSSILVDGLRAWLEPQELTMVAIDRHTLRITSKQHAQRSLEVEFYPAESILSVISVDDLVRQIREEVGETYFGAAEVPGAIAFDDASRFLVVALPQAQQRIVERLLANGGRSPN